jgi:hypothetical protein
MNRRPATLRLLAVAKCALPAILFALLLVPASHAEDQPKEASVVASAAAVADGRPWTMYAVDQQRFTLTLMPNGTGTMEPNFLAPELTWWQSGETLCIRPSPLKSEHCVTLLVREGGYDAVENSALFFRLRR